MDGGKRAASLLKQRVGETLRSWDSNTPHHLQVVVRVYANFKGLARVYKEMDSPLHDVPIDEFVRGFNMADDVCDYIDAGNGKECSDEKVKGNLLSPLLYATHLTLFSQLPLLFG